MKIRIIKYSEPNSWYRYRVGATYKVLEVDTNNNRYITHKGRIVDSYVDFDDCVVLDEQ